jgi:hypothetical protein
LNLGGFIDRRCSWTGRFAANIKNMRPSLEQGICMMECVLDGRVFATVGERVWCDIQDAHESGCGKRDLFATPVSEGEVGHKLNDVF